MAKRFTFADAKNKIKSLEEKIAGIEFNDNVFTSREVKKLKRQRVVLPLIGFVLGIAAYIGFFSLTTEKATVIEEVAGVELLMGDFVSPDIAHKATGSFKIVATEGGMRAIELSKDFSIVHAPDPHVRVNGMVIAKVVNYEGAQVYPIPNFIAEDITSVNIWCEIADISLGNGELMKLALDEVVITSTSSDTDM